MHHLKFTTKEEFCVRLGISRATLYRRLKKLGIQVSGNLLSPEEQRALLKALGAQPEPPAPQAAPTDVTN